MENEKKQLSQKDKDRQKVYQAIYSELPKVKEKKRKIFIQKYSNPEYREKMRARNLEYYYKNKEKCKKRSLKNYYKNKEKSRTDDPERYLHERCRFTDEDKKNIEKSSFIARELYYKIYKHYPKEIDK